MKKYYYLKNFLSKEELDIAHQYSLIKHRANTESFDLQTDADTSFYSDPLMELLLDKKTSIIEQTLNKKLWPTYSYLRVYHKFSSLEKHIDRESCEISVTCTLGRDKPWPIFLDGESIDILPGDGLLYFGAIHEHWREEFDGDYCSQVFFHYVDQEGKFKNFKYDNRQYLGLLDKIVPF